MEGDPPLAKAKVHTPGEAEPIPLRRPIEPECGLAIVSAPRALIEEEIVTKQAMSQRLRPQAKTQVTRP
jgi:hypothetical protein